MYLAPLNYDRYFKKVFSDLKIAKRFLEDFLDIEIQEIELLPVKKAITDQARFVEFDFRCKIDDNYVIIDMQQWYKADVVKRFYLYNSLNTSLQLENLSTKFIELPEQKVKEVKDYSTLTPVITLIWFVQETFNFTDDYISYTLTPENISAFMRDIKLWGNPEIEKILQEREKLLAILDNNTKNLRWFQENKLIYVFQKNVVKNPNFSKYKDWFEFADKTLNKLNDKFAYNKFENDAIFKEIINRLKTEIESDEEIRYINDYDEYMQKVFRYEDAIRNEGIAEGTSKGRKEAEDELKPMIEAERQQKEQAELQAKKAEQQALQEKQKLIQTVVFLKSLGIDNKIISQKTGLLIDEIEKL